MNWATENIFENYNKYKSCLQRQTDSIGWDWQSTNYEDIKINTSLRLQKRGFAEVSLYQENQKFKRIG